jgi:hypothetical protein
VNELAGALGHGQFEPETIRNSTSDRSVYELALEVGKSSLPIDILDYPGGWLQRGGPEWKECADWIKASSVLVLPVDAVVAMQCATVAEEKACRIRLAIEEVTEVVRDWAKARVGANAPATLILAPVKCETYLVAPGATQGTADALQKRLVRKLYGDMFAMLAAEVEDSSLVSAYYVPVNTIGCVDLVDAGWAMAEDGNLECHPIFRVLPPHKRKVEGALDVLILLARMVASAEDAQGRNPFKNLLRYLTGESSQLRAAIARLNGLSLSPRAHQIELPVVA